MNLKYFLPIFLVILTSACQQSESSEEPVVKKQEKSLPYSDKKSTPTTNSSTKQEIGTVLNDSLETIKAELKKLQPQANQIGDQAKDEIEKLYIFEYTVKSFATELSDLELEVELHKLGAERWDCFDVVAQEKSLKVFCKRLPKTYLRYIPRFF